MLYWTPLNGLRITLPGLLPVSQDMMEAYVEPSPCALIPRKIYIVTNISESIM